VLAFLDRTELTVPLERRIYVVVLENEVLLFDEIGEVIDEPGAFTPGGRQSFEGENNFLQEWTDDTWYKLASATDVSEPEPSQTPSPTTQEAPPLPQDPEEQAAWELAADGQRLKVSIGQPALWYGGFVHRLEDEVLIAYDDGDLRKYSKAELTRCVTAKQLVAVEDGELGIIASEGGLPMAAEIVMYAMGRGSEKPVGVLVGKTDDVLAHFSVSGESDPALLGYNPPLL